MIRGISAADAVDELRIMVAASSHPVLDDTRLLRILYNARRPDSDRKNPNEDGWSSTYDLDAAAAEGWRIKAGEVAGDYTFQSDDSKLDRSDVIKHCLAMEKTYLLKASPYPSRYGTDRVRTVNDDFEALLQEELEDI